MSFQSHSHVQSRPPCLRVHTLLFPVSGSHGPPGAPAETTAPQPPGANATSCSHLGLFTTQRPKGPCQHPSQPRPSSAPSPPETQLLLKAHRVHVCKATCRAHLPDLTGQPSLNTQHTLSCTRSPCFTWRHWRLPEEKASAPPAPHTDPSSCCLPTHLEAGGSDLGTGA